MLSNTEHDRSPAPLGGTQTLARGLQILEHLVQNPQPQRPSQIARATGLERNAVYRLLRELESRSYVTREQDSTRYVLGSGLVALAAVVLQRVDIGRLARPIMEALEAETEETVSLHIRSGHRRVAVDALASRQPISHKVEIGETVPLYQGASGKVILAFVDAADFEAVLKESAADRPRGQSQLRELIKRARTQGYVSTVGDRNPGVSALSAPVFNTDGVLGALTVTGPSSRWTEDKMQKAVPLLLAHCADLSAALGYVARSAPTDPD
jgi:IclR family transcriptional regulator, KDG regulon repressor